jgi:hypothetical protein
VRIAVVLDTTRAGFEARVAEGASWRALSVPTSMHRLPNLTLSVFAIGTDGDSNATVCLVWFRASGIFVFFCAGGKKRRLYFLKGAALTRT